jgi:subtilisin family serine protease
MAALGGSALACGEQAGKAGSSLHQALQSKERVAVIVALREPQDGAADALAARGQAIARSQQAVLDGLSAEEFTLTRRWDNIPALAGEVSRRGLDRLLLHPEVVSVDTEGVRFASAAESVPLIRGDEARAAGATGKGVIVAVIDTGIDSDHRDLFDAVVEEVCFCGGCCPGGASTASGKGAARDDDGHGTNVTGIINSAGRVSPVGVAPDTGIVAIRVLGPRGGRDADILSALDYVLARPQIKVVNMSLGGGRFSTVCDEADSSNRAFGSAIARLRSQGTLTAVASGNEAFSDAVASPACINAALAVGAVYDDNIGGIRASVCSDATTAADQVTCFSNSSPLVELLAPGAMITSSGPGGGTLSEGGTSQASPHVAGAAAVLLQDHRDLTPSQIIDVLKRTGRPVTDRKNGLTLPRIDLKAALDALR